MHGVDAMAYPAEMIEGETFGNRPPQEFIGDAVREERPPVDLEDAVARVEAPGRPEPTAARAVLVDLRPEPRSVIHVPMIPTETRRFNRRRVLVHVKIPIPRAGPQP